MLTQLNLGVIVRTCGRSPLFLRRALESITAQTRAPAQIIVVDDGADAAGVEAALGKLDLRGITLRHLPRDVRIQPKPNRSTALNRGIAGADTRWISFLDDDDTWAPQFLERAAPFLENTDKRPDFGGVVTQTVVVDERMKDGEIIEKGRRPFNPGLQVIDLAALAAGNRFTLNAVIMHQEVFKTVGLYREDLPVLEDWEFNVRAAARFHFEVIPEALARYHQRPAGDASANSSLAEHARVKVRLRNEWLRADLAAGRLGLGQLALVGELRGLGAVLEVGRRWRERLSGWLG